MSISLLFNHVPADYTSPAYLVRQAHRELELLELRRCRTVRPEIMRLTAKPKSCSQNQTITTCRLLIVASRL